jgi:hypothetical protein
MAEVHINIHDTPERKVSRFSDRAILGLALTGAALFGGAVTLLEMHSNETGGEKVLLAQACHDSYSESDSITTSTVNCIEEGWVPGLGQASIAPLDDDTPNELLEAYISGHQEASRNYNIPVIGTWALVGFSIFGYVGCKVQEEMTNSASAVNP